MAWNLVLEGPGGVKVLVEQDVEEWDLEHGPTRDNVAHAVRNKLRHIRTKYRELKTVLDELPDDMRLKDQAHDVVVTVADLKREGDLSKFGARWYLGEIGAAKVKALCVLGVGVLYSEER